MRVSATHKHTHAHTHIQSYTHTHTHIMNLLQDALAGGAGPYRQSRQISSHDTYDLYTCTHQIIYLSCINTEHDTDFFPAA